PIRDRSLRHVCLLRELFCPVYMVQWSLPHQHLRSFPTRRSSDLLLDAELQEVCCGEAEVIVPDGCNWSPLYLVSARTGARLRMRDRKSTRLNASHQIISYAVFCLKKKSK